LTVSKELITHFLDPALTAEAATECFADDGVWIAAEGDEPGRTYHKKEIPELLRHLRGVSEQYAAQGVAIDYGDPVEVGDRVYLEAAVRTADGTAIARVLDVFTVRDNKIVVKDVYRKG
jgi:ketosteroid isomerase-like protein